MSGIEIGCHVSTAGGVEKSPARGAELGARCMQVFTRNQMSWKHKELTGDEAARFKANLAGSGVGTVMSHDSYLINLCSPDPEKHKKSTLGFDDEVRRCTALGIPLLNFHPGAHMGEGVDAGIKKIADTLNGVCARFPDSPVKLVLETVAGQGSTVGRSFGELADILARLDDPSRFGICVDTAHVFAAGYDLGSEGGWEKTWEEYDRLLGFDTLLAFHVNDSKVPLGSQVDRHALIGRGHIGPGAFVRLVTDERTRNVPMFLETPAGNEGYTLEINWLYGAARGELTDLPEIDEQKRGY
ncbi:MAG: deoxyribonuclease IV [Leptospirillia bacterium]